MPPKPRIARFRSAVHLARLRKLACTIPGCRGTPVDPHHLRHLQANGMKLKPGDSLCVPLRRWKHHSATSNDGVHYVGDEAGWWEARGIDPGPIAARLWAEMEGT
jgi:hypothetical protein